MRFGMLRVGLRCRRLLMLLGLLSLTGSWTLVAAPSALAGQYGSSVVQVGAWSSSSQDEYATGVQAYLGHYPLPQTTGDNAPMFVWIGDKLNDGTFIQVGTLTRGTYCGTQMALFFQAWTVGGKLIRSWQGDCGQFSIPTYAAFTMSTSEYDGGGYYLWNFYTPIGNTVQQQFLDANTGTNVPQIVGELVAVAPAHVNSADSIGPVGANPALASQHTMGGSYVKTPHAFAYYGYSGVCPPENFQIDGFDHVGFGTGIGGSCVSYGTTLW